MDSYNNNTMSRVLHAQAGKGWTPGNGLVVELLGIHWQWLLVICCCCCCCCCFCCFCSLYGRRTWSTTNRKQEAQQRATADDQNRTTRDLVTNQQRERRNAQSTRSKTLRPPNLNGSGSGKVYSIRLFDRPGTEVGQGQRKNRYTIGTHKYRAVEEFVDRDDDCILVVPKFHCGAFLLTEEGYEPLCTIPWFDLMRAKEGDYLPLPQQEKMYCIKTDETSTESKNRVVLTLAPRLQERRELPVRLFYDDNKVLGRCQRDEGRRYLIAGSEYNEVRGTCHKTFKNWITVVPKGSVAVYVFDKDESSSEEPVPSKLPGEHRFQDYEGKKKGDWVTCRGVQYKIFGLDLVWFQVVLQTQQPQMCAQNVQRENPPLSPSPASSRLETISNGRRHLGSYTNEFSTELLCNTWPGGQDMNRKAHSVCYSDHGTNKEWVISKSSASLKRRVPRCFCSACIIRGEEIVRASLVQTGGGEVVVEMVVRNYTVCQGKRMVRDTIKRFAENRLATIVEDCEE